MKFFKKVLLFIILTILIIGVLIIYKGYDMYKDAIGTIELDSKIIQLRQSIMLYLKICQMIMLMQLFRLKIIDFTIIKV